MSINDTALRYLATRPRTTEEVRTHLDKKGFPAEDIAECLGYLAEMHYVDDKRYCREYYDYGSLKGKSLRLMQYELSEKGIHENLFQDALAEMEEEEGIELSTEERGRAFAVAEKVARKSGSIEALKLSGKIGRRLKGLGYDSDLIYEIVGRYMKEDDEEGI